MNIQLLYDNVEKAKRVLSAANKLGKEHRSAAMRDFNKHYNALRQAQRGGRVRTYSADFETRVDGIPCGVVVLEYRDVSGWSSSPEMAEPDDRGFEFILVNRKGYRIEWLERKLTECDCKRIEAEYLAWREAMKMTNEQIQAILDGAPEGEQHINIPVAGGLTHKVHRIDDLREILELRQDVERLKASIESAVGNMEYAAFDLFGETELKPKYGERIIESTCPEKSLLIAIRDLKEAREQDHE